MREQSDETVERMLAGLRRVEAPDGIERRVLHAVQERTITRAGWPGSIPGRSTAMGLSLACGAAMAVALVMVLAPTRQERIAPVAPRVSRQGSEAGRRSPSIVGDAARDAGRVAAAAISRPSPGGAQHVRRVDGKTGKAMTMHENAALTYPAPSLPVTNQERLLLRVVHQGDVVELAMLDAKTRARESQNSDTEFERFFGKATPPDPDHLQIN